MFSKLHSLGVAGLDGFVVTTEVDVSGGLPQFAIVGLPDSAVKEAADRVRSALKNLGFEFPARRITVNLAPADVRKTGAVYDLPVLLGVLAASGQIDPLPPDSAFVGELSLNGEVRPVSGVLSMALACVERGVRRFYLPAANAREAALCPDVQAYPVRDVKQLLASLRGEETLPPLPATRLDLEDGMQGIPDFADVHGQPEARRAMEIAAAGLHNIILIGAPGAGKSMLAKRLPGILPPLSFAEAVELNKIYSVVGQLGQGFLTSRPFRSPHHGVSAPGLAGGGSPPRPGEISLANHGVLFLDELPEFQREALEILRQPMEDGHVSISRVAGTACYPSRFMLVAAMNPCPCGYYGHPERECRCQAGAMERYLQKVSGPLLDRIDLHVEVQPVGYEEISAAQGGENSHGIRERVLRAREFQQKRSRETEPLPNARLEGEALRENCPMTPMASQTLKTAFERLGLSARGYDRVLRVSRTIADLDASQVIDLPHVAEAVQYRNLDRKYWY